VESVRKVVRACLEQNIEFLTLFAFSSENWQRPVDEVTYLMELFAVALESEITKLHESGVRFRVIGDRSRFESRLVELIQRCERLTRGNSGLILTVAANYGGRWDIVQAINRMVSERSATAGAVIEAEVTPYLALGDAPDPDLFIRTGGEQRISNFLLWQLAYTELYFTDTLWPDFDSAALNEAISAYRRRERRYGRIREELPAVAESSTPRRVVG